VSLLNFIVLVIIAGICGSIAQTISGFSRGGCIVSIIVGFIGALIGEWLKRSFNLPEFFILGIGHERFAVIWSIIGAVIFTAVLNLITSRK
jgi:uncharacterized membrane protein YeaQ/YmgE (transglycosylase-associated protein family)